MEVELSGEIVDEGAGQSMREWHKTLASKQSRSKSCSPTRAMSEEGEMKEKERGGGRMKSVVVPVPRRVEFKIPKGKDGDTERERADSIEQVQASGKLPRRIEVVFRVKEACPVPACREARKYTRRRDFETHWRAVHMGVIVVYACPACVGDVSRGPRRGVIGQATRPADMVRHLKEVHGAYFAAVDDIPSDWYQIQKVMNEGFVDPAPYRYPLAPMFSGRGTPKVLAKSSSLRR